MLCEGLYVVLSLMGGYYTQGTSLRVLQSHTRKGLGNVPWRLLSSMHLTRGMLQGSAASSTLLQLFGEASGEKRLHCASSVIQS